MVSAKDDIRDHIDDNEYENDSNEYDEEAYANEFKDDDDKQTTSPPQKGITAWLAHLHRKKRHQSIFEKIRDFFFFTS